jgi:hypothetical protein
MNGEVEADGGPDVPRIAQDGLRRILSGQDGKWGLEMVVSFLEHPGDNQPERRGRNLATIREASEEYFERKL